jgi:tetratricopeptide (TPR) repeat protein
LKVKMTTKSRYLRYRLLQGLLLSALPVSSMAQPLEEVSLAYQRQGIVATIHMSGRIQYLRHFPESRGKTLEIYYVRMQDASSNETWLDNEVRNSPPSGLIPSFTVTTRDQSTKPKLVIEFAREAEFSVSTGKDNRSLLITIRPEKQAARNEPLPFLPTINPEVKPAKGATLTPEEVLAAKINQQARALMVQGRDALAAKNNDAAVEALNNLLLLPPNDYTQDAQEWVGVARERAGEPDKAKVEYDLYLKLYPGSAGAARVAQRLNGLSGLGAAGKPAAVGEEKMRPPTVMSFGSISSRYYYGRSKISTTSTFNGVTTTDSASMTDQSMLITSVDASERYIEENRDSRLVFRDIKTSNFISGQPSPNLVSAAYGEVKGRTDNYLLRLGRQSAIGGGVLGRFDGLAASYGNAQELRVNAVGGALVDYSPGPKPRFAGVSVDMGAFSFYGIDQKLEGIQDRRAVGTEYRYVDDKRNAYGLLDYDTYFKAVNAAQFMGMTNDVAALPDKSMVSFMLDHRKTPSLSIRNALIGATTSSVSDLLQTMSLSSLRDLALARTAITNTAQVGITVPILEKWQVGGDFRLTNTTGLGASGQTLNPTIDPNTGLPIQCTGTPTAQGCIAAQPGRGLERSATGQVTGSGLYTQGDIWSASLTLSTSSSVNGRSLFFYNHAQTSYGWMIDTTLQLSSYKDQFDGKMTQIMPMLRGSYRFKERFTFDADGGYQWIDYSGPQTSSKTSRIFCSVGLRWDF